VFWLLFFYSNNPCPLAIHIPRTGYVLSVTHVAILKNSELSYTWQDNSPITVNIMKHVVVTVQKKISQWYISYDSYLTIQHHVDTSVHQRQTSNTCTNSVLPSPPPEAWLHIQHVYQCTTSHPTFPKFCKCEKVTPNIYSGYPRLSAF